MSKEALGRRAMARWLSSLVVLAAGASAGPVSRPAEDATGPAFSFEPATAADPGCTEIQPDALVPRVIDTSLYRGRARSCLPGITNGRSHVALGTLEMFGFPNVEKFWTLKPLWGGSSIGSIHGAAQGMTLLPQDDGWVSSEPISEWGVNQLRGWSSSGSLLHSTFVPLGSVVPDFTSGALVAFGESEEPFGLKVQRFASDAAPRSPAVDVAGEARGLVAAGVNASRATLVLFDGSTTGLPPGHMGGRWLDPCGAALTDVFDAGLTYSSASSGVLAPLYDGSLALQVEGQWVARFIHLSTAPAGPAPAWLAERPDTRLVWIRHGKGYALIPNGGESVPECRQQIFLYSKAGHSCGAATFTVDNLPCTTPGMEVGPDGTAVLLSPRPGACTDPSCSYRECTYFWWPNVFGCRGSGRPDEGCPGALTGAGQTIPVDTGNARRPPEGTRPVHCGKAP